MSIHEWSLLETQAALASHDISAVELTGYFLDRIDRLDPQVGAFVWVEPESALARAAEVDTRIAQGEIPTPGMGVPSADKDLVRRAGMPTGYGSASRANGPIAAESDPMAVWLDRIGAISVGKTRTSEFGLSGYTEPTHGGPTRNPHNLSHTAGGSSGGAAAAVAAGLLPFAPGSDGGGSIRIPALACGVAGWKPSRGMIPAGSGFEFLGHLAVPGLMARELADIHLLAPLLTEGALPWATRAPSDSHRPIRRIGVTTSHPWPHDWQVGLSDESEQALALTVDTLTQMGYAVERFHWEPDRDYAEHFFTLWSVSAASIDISEEDEGLLEPLTRYLRAEGLGVSAVDLATALKQLTVFERDTITRFADFDAVLTPGLAMPAPKLGWFDREHPETNFRQQVQFTPWTSFVNVAGLPAVSLPTGHTEQRLPMGVQLIGTPGADMAILELGSRLQREFTATTRWPANFG